MDIVKGDKLLQQTLQKISDKAPEATAFALNGIAYDIRTEVQAKLPTWVKLTRKFLPNSVVYEKATTGNLAAAVGFHKRVTFANLLEQGGVRTPKGRALAIPVDVKTTQSGGIAQSNRPQAIMQKKGVFSGVMNGVAGIWQSTKRIPIKLLYVFKKRTKYNHHFLQFTTTANNVAKAKYEEKFKAALLRMLSK